MRLNTEVNLARLSKTTLPKEFVEQHCGEWNHQEIGRASCRERVCRMV